MDISVIDNFADSSFTNNSCASFTVTVRSIFFFGDRAPNVSFKSIPICSSIVHSWHRFFGSSISMLPLSNDLFQLFQNCSAIRSNIFFLCFLLLLSHVKHVHHLFKLITASLFCSFNSSTNTLTKR